jgi:hypothetical protein
MQVCVLTAVLGFRGSWSDRALTTTSLADNTDYACVIGIIAQLDAGTRTCECSVECDEIGYDASLSASQWPSYQFEQAAMKSYGFTTGASPGMKLSENLLKIQVYFKSLNVQNVRESPTYQVSVPKYVLPRPRKKTLRSRHEFGIVQNKN